MTASRSDRNGSLPACGPATGPSVLAIRTAAVALAGLSLLGACSRPEPPDSFWGFRWGAPIDSILALTEQFRHRLGEAHFAVQVDSHRLTFFDVQYGMGYGRVQLDFTGQGALWHGSIRIALDSEAAADSVLEALHRRHGRPTAAGRLDRREGSRTWWRSPDLLDRDFFAAGLAPAIDPARVRALDFEQVGCLTVCPIYSVRLLRSGEALLWGIQGIDSVGGFRGRYDSTVFPGLAERGVRPSYLAAANYYGYRGIDLRRRAVTVDYGTFRRAVEAVEQAGPPHIEEFLDRLAEAARGIAWIRMVSWDTVRIIDQPRIGLDSLEVLTRRSPP